MFDTKSHKDYELGVISPEWWGLSHNLAQDHSHTLVEHVQELMEDI
jgi:hypothetical protein